MTDWARSAPAATAPLRLRGWREVAASRSFGIARGHVTMRPPKTRRHY